MRSPRLVRTIVCAYTREELPAAWLQVFRRFERMVERAGLRIRVRLEPLEALPEAFDVIVVPPELRARAAEVARDARIIATTRADATAAANDLLRELEAATELYAERVRPGEPKIVVHRGPEVL
jgi:hypothetical protein